MHQRLPLNFLTNRSNANVPKLLSPPSKNLKRCGLSITLSYRFGKYGDGGDAIFIKAEEFWGKACLFGASLAERGDRGAVGDMKPRRLRRIIEACQTHMSYTRHNLWQVASRVGNDATAG